MRILIGIALSIFAAYAQPAASIRDVDFRNFAHAWGEPGDGVPAGWRWLKGHPQTTVQLVAGRKRFSDGSYLTLRSVTYGELNGDREDDVAVDLSFSSGGTANWHYLYVYSFDSGRPTLRSVLESGSRADGGLVRVEIRKGLLILDFQDTELRTRIVVRTGMSGCVTGGSRIVSSKSGESKYRCTRNPPRRTPKTAE